MIRAFIALDINDQIRGALGQLGDELATYVPDRAVRWVWPETVHLTLKFLGDIEPERVQPVQETLISNARGIQPFQIEVSGLGSFPNPRRPRVLWVGIEENSGGLARLQAEVEAGMAELGFKRERRRFHPHLTLGRVRRSASRSDVEHVAEVLETKSVGALGTVLCGQVHLYRSDLKPTGAVYSRLASAKLGGAA